MAFTPRNDWEAGETYPAARLIDLEAAVAANASAAATATTANETANSTAQDIADLRETVASKQYVDDLVSAQAALTTALTTRVSDLEAANTALVSRLEALETPAE